MRSPSPRDVYAGACDTIASFLPDFSYSRRTRSAVRVRGDWSDHVSLSSSHFNRRAQWIALRVHISLRNTRLAEWRDKTESPVMRGPGFAGSYLHYLRDARPPASEWNLAEGVATVTQDVRDRLDKDGLPFLAAASDPDRYPDGLPERWLELMDSRYVVEMLLSYERDDAVGAYLSHLWRRHPEVREETLVWLADPAALEWNRRNGFSPGTYGEGLAQLAVQYGLVQHVSSFPIQQTIHPSRPDDGEPLEFELTVHRKGSVKAIERLALSHRGAMSAVRRVWPNALPHNLKGVRLDPQSAAAIQPCVSTALDLRRYTYQLWTRGGPRRVVPLDSTERRDTWGEATDPRHR